MLCNANLKPLKAFQKYKPGGLFSEFYESLTEALFGLSFVAGVKRGGGRRGQGESTLPREPITLSSPLHPPRPLRATRLPAAYLHARQRKPPAAQAYKIVSQKL